MSTIGFAVRIIWGTDWDGVGAALGRAVGAGRCGRIGVRRGRAQVRSRVGSGDLGASGEGAESRDWGWGNGHSGNGLREHQAECTLLE